MKVHLIGSLSAYFLCLLLVQRTVQDNQCAFCIGKMQRPKNNSQSITNVRNFTTLSGAPVDSMTSSMSAGCRGPLLLKDIPLVSSLANFNRERIPERTVHAKGGGAFGYFKVTSTTITKYCKADLFSKVGKITRVVTRFSTSAGLAGSQDTVRDVRGFAVKFYTNEGNWDFVGFHTSVYNLRDPIHFPSQNHAGRLDQVTHTTNLNNFWDFATRTPQEVNFLMYVWSESGIPNGFRHMDGHALVTFRVVNAKGCAFYARFQFKTNQGIEYLDPVAAATAAANDPNYSIRDLYTAIDEGNYPSWILYCQIMTIKEAEEYRWNPFDSTKYWPQVEFPLIEIGELVLDRNPTNYFADVEQAAYSPANMVPGIEASPGDKVFHARIFAYPDAQRYRLGANHQQLPVNCPYMVTVNNIHRDGFMRFGDNGGGRPSYYPNGYNIDMPDPRGENQAYKVWGDAKRWNENDDDNYSQATLFWKSLNDSQKTAMVSNIAGSAYSTNTKVQAQIIEFFSNVAPEMGQGIADVLVNMTSLPSVVCSST